MKPRSPSTGGKGQFPHTDYFFHSGFGQWHGGDFWIQEFLQFGTRIPYRGCTGTCQGNGGVCIDCSDLGVARALYGDYRGETVE